jgi:hypothetical protein
MMERYFAVDMPFWRFLLNTLVVSCAGLVPLLLLYVALTPGFGPMLINNGFALRLFLRQVVTNGLLVVFTVNYLGFFLYAALVAQRGREAAAAVLLIDPPLRIVTFILLHGLIYFLSADWFGSFGGDHWLALRVVAPTLARSAAFANLSGVYLYATLGSAVPVYTVAIDRLLARQAVRRSPLGRLADRLPGRSAAILLAFGLFAVCVLLLTGVATAIVYLQPS